MKLPLLMFAHRVLRDFRKNQGLLLAGAVAYYTLLSLVPLFTLLLVGLSHFIDRERLIHVVAVNLDFLVPGQAHAITAQIASFLQHRQVVGVVGSAALLFFSAMAFSVLESAMATIFHHRVRTSRHFLVSAIMPYLFVMALGAGLLLLTLVTGVVEAVGSRSVHWGTRTISLAGASQSLVRLIGAGCAVVILTGFYVLMPIGRVKLTRAALGAVAATALWEAVRHILVWYFANVSMVNVLYGSLATTIVVLLTLEAAAVILLLGAQVIAELERGGVRPWSEDEVPPGTLPTRET